MDAKNGSRKRRTGTQEKTKSTEDKSATTRPKRKCTMNRKKVYPESEPDDIEEKDSPASVQKPNLSAKKVTPTKPGIVMINTHSGKLIGKLDLSAMKAKYRWIEHDAETSKVRCSICIASNLKKWFIVANENMTNFEESLTLHEGSEEHRRSSKGMVFLSPKTTAPMGKRVTSPVTSPQAPKKNNPKHMRDVYCIPMECVDPIPLPGAQLRSLLRRHGLMGRVNFDHDLTPARLREDISKSLSKTFSLRAQELLQFDYLILSQDKTELNKPEKMLHFDAKAVLPLVGDAEVYILLKQKAPAQNVDWKQLLFQENQLRNLTDGEYKEVMLSVMHRLSSGKHKKDSSEEQKALVESLISDYKLNNYHQLVYIGNSLDQLVLFTEKRRFEAFQAHHTGHPDLQTTFRNIFNMYYWNGIEDWITAQVKACPGCVTKYGEHVLTSATIAMDKIDGEIKKNKSPSKAAVPLAPRPQQPAFVQRIVPIPKPIAKSPPAATGNTEVFPVASIIPPMSMPKSGDELEKALSPPPLTVKKEQVDVATKRNLLPPREEDSIDVEDTDRDETLYEEDLEEAIQQNSKARSDGSHCVNAMWAMYLLQQRGMFCDFFIMLLPSVYNNLKKPKIHGVHRIVFAAISTRIRQITKTTIKIGGKVTCEGLENVIEYGYTGRLTGIREMQLGTITQISNTAMALDIKIDHYLQKHRPDFTKTSAKILVTTNPGDKPGSSGDSSEGDLREQGPFLCS